MWIFWCEFDMNLMIKIMTSIKWCCLWILCYVKVLILLVFWVILRFYFWWFVRGYFVVKYEIFGWVREKVDFSRVWGIFGGIVVIFDDVKSGEMLDFSGFCRSGYRSDVWCRMSRKRWFYKEFVDRRDMPFLATGKLLYNVIYPPIYTLIR